MRHDFFVDGVAFREPGGAVRAGEAAFVGEPEAAVEGDPEHDFGVDEVLLLVAHFPDGHVGVWECVRGWELMMEAGQVPSQIVRTKSRISRTATHWSQVTGLPYLLYK